LLIEVGKLAREGRFDYLVIESTGIAEPLPIAETFTFRDEKGQSLSDLSRLDTLVTVVDAVNFMHHYLEAPDLGEIGQSLGEDDTRNLADLLVDQVEFANVILVSKADLVGTDELRNLIAILRQLNPDAQVQPMVMGQVPLATIFDTHLFDFNKAEQAPGWMKEMRGQHTPETEEYGIRAFSYRARRPFHPQRFHRFLHQAGHDNGILLRSKGFFWLASRHDMAGTWSQAGGIMHHAAAGRWWAAVPPEQWPDDPLILTEIKQDWAEPFGDRRQELVFIGQQLDEATLRAELDACLLTDEELAEGPDVWRHYEDRFPAWPIIGN
jgi:G3E family GTPase